MTSPLENEESYFHLRWLLGCRNEVKAVLGQGELGARFISKVRLTPGGACGRHVLQFVLSLTKRWLAGRGGAGRTAGVRAIPSRREAS